MFSLKFFKYFLILTITFCSSCRYWQNSSNSNTSTNQPEIAEIRSEIPFATKEPEIFQADIIIKNEGEEEKTFIARKDGKSFSRKGDIAALQTEPNKSFLINFAKKIYVENIGNSTAKVEASGETLNDFLTTEWLNQKTDAKFESLGTENGLSKYRTSFENSESLIFVDEIYKIPVRQEFYSIEGDTKNLVYSMELQNIKLAVDEQLFELPKDFRKVSPEEFNK
jgi:hypothetical protein